MLFDVSQQLWLFQSSPRPQILFPALLIERATAMTLVENLAQIQLCLFYMMSVVNVFVTHLIISDNQTCCISSSLAKSPALACTHEYSITIYLTPALIKTLYRPVSKARALALCHLHSLFSQLLPFTAPSLLSHLFFPSLPHSLCTSFQLTQVYIRHPLRVPTIQTRTSHEPSHVIFELQPSNPITVLRSLSPLRFRLRESLTIRYDT